jgi:hypothetical protein
MDLFCHSLHMCNVPAHQILELDLEVIFKLNIKVIMIHQLRYTFSCLSVDHQTATQEVKFNRTYAREYSIQTDLVFLMRLRN